jgi:hypothetical protein
MGLVLAGCESPNSVMGSLSVQSDMPMINSNGQAVTLTKGAYSTRVDFKKDRSAIVSIKVRNGQLKFAIPRSLADYYGKIKLSAEELRQPFGLNGAVTSARDAFSEDFSERCQAGWRTEYQCERRRDHHGRRCEWVDVPVYGTQYVHEDGFYETKHIDIDLVGKTKYAKFSGRYELGRKVTKRQLLSRCLR